MSNSNRGRHITKDCCYLKSKMVIINNSRILPVYNYITGDSLRKCKMDLLERPQRRWHLP